MPTAVRWFVASFIALWTLGWAAYVVFSPSPAGGFVGWDLGTDGVTITHVTIGGPAEGAGVKVGDSLHWSSLSTLARANLGVDIAAPVGARVDAPVIHDGHVRHMTIVAQRWDDDVQYGFIAEVLAGAVLLAFGIVLVFMRPCRMTWGFLLAFLTFGAGNQSSMFLAQSTPFAYIIENCGWSILNGIAVAGMLTFTARFPNDKARGPLQFVDRIAVPFGALLAVFGVASDLWILYAPAPPPAWVMLANQYLFIGAFSVLALFAMVTGFALAKGSDRHRILPTLVAFSVYVGTYLIINTTIVTDATLITVTDAISVVAMLALAAAAAHGVIRHRVMDVSFLISRAIVYTILSSVFLGAFSIIEFVSTKLMSRVHLTLMLDLIAALAFSFSIDWLHLRIDRFVDSVLFRRRHLAELRLECAAHMLPQAESNEMIDEVLVVEACDVLGLASAAVFRHDEDIETFARTLARGWDATGTAQLTKGDSLMVSLLAELQPLESKAIRLPVGSAPQGFALPILAMPLAVRSTMLGVVLYGGHIGGEAIDPDERRTLVHLAEAAAAAYERIRTEAIVAESTKLREELASMSHERNILRDMIRTLRAPM